MFYSNYALSKSTEYTFKNSMNLALSKLAMIENMTFGITIFSIIVYLYIFG